MSNEPSWSFDNSRATGHVSIAGDQITVIIDAGKEDRDVLTLTRYLDEPPHADGRSTVREALAYWAPEIAGRVEQEVRRRLGRA